MLKRYLVHQQPHHFRQPDFCCGGFFLAAKTEPASAMLLLQHEGVGLVIASGCVVNNTLIETSFKDKRPQNRELVQGNINTDVVRLRLGFIARRHCVTVSVC